MIHDLFFKFFRLTEHKAIEVQFSTVVPWQWFKFNFDITRKQDHAGVLLHVEVPFLFLAIQLYDCRHWDDETDNWAA